MINQLDLHGVRHGDVPRQVDQFIGKHLMEGTSEVKIIIGHSDQMKKIVDDTLKDYGLNSTTTFLSTTTLSIKLQ